MNTRTGKFLVNGSMLGINPTGLGVYANHCLSTIERQFCCQIASSTYIPTEPSVSFFKSPTNITIGAEGRAAINRLFFSLNSLPTRNAFVYSPTQHGVFNTSNQVITIHDLICIRHPHQHRSQYYFFRYVLPHLIKRCKAIFAVSETERRNIAEYYHYPLDKIYVVPNGVNTDEFKPTSHIESFEPPYLLVVGANYPHKNIAEVLDNHEVWSKDFHLKIISCKGAEKENLSALVVKYGLHDRVEFPGYVTQAQLISLYQRCTALVFPSLSEGFGIPPLEAIACGKPVIASDIPVHKEVLGDSAFFITPTQKDTWQQAFSDLQNNEKLVTKLELGKSVIKKYTWEQSANILVKSLLAVEPQLSNLLKSSSD